MTAHFRSLGNNAPYIDSLLWCSSLSYVLPFHANRQQSTYPTYKKSRFSFYCDNNFLLYSSKKQCKLKIPFTSQILCHHIGENVILLFLSVTWELMNIWYLFFRAVSTSYRSWIGTVLHSPLCCCPSQNVLSLPGFMVSLKIISHVYW